MRVIYCLLAGLVAVTTCWGTEEGTTVDKSRLYRRFGIELQNYNATTNAVSIETLREQLAKRKGCLVRLPEMNSDAMKPSDLYEQRRSAVVMIGYLYTCGKCDKWHTGTASGFAITADGVLLTNYHVINNEKAQLLGAMTIDGQFYPVKEVLAGDKLNDIAVLKVDAENLQYLSLQAETRVGEDVWVISHPSRNYFLFTRGMISAHYLHSGAQGQKKILAVTADYGGGSSGAPVLNGCGEAVGMVRSTQAVRPAPGNHTTNSYAQMVVGNCIPAEAILALVSGEDSL